jgi:hypothetical protein
LAEIAPGNFRRHYFADRRQKAWFLPAAALGRLRRGYLDLLMVIVIKRARDLSR